MRRQKLIGDRPENMMSLGKSTELSTRRKLYIWVFKSHNFIDLLAAESLFSELVTSISRIEDTIVGLERMRTGSIGMPTKVDISGQSPEKEAARAVMTSDGNSMKVKAM